MSLSLVGDGSGSAGSIPTGVQVTYGAVVCVEAELTGDVRIGLKTIIHPCAKILAKNGPIIIGDFNIIEEMATIVNWSTEPMVIGNNNVFEVSSVVMAKSVGDHNVFETKCFVGEGIVIPNGCTFGAATSVGMGRDVESGKILGSGSEKDLPIRETSVLDNSVFYGEPLKHRIAGEKPAMQTLQIDFLAKILPNYHHVKLYNLKKEVPE